MAKFKKRTGSRWSWKKIISAVVCVAILALCIGGASVLFTNDSKTIYATTFSVGGLDEYGKANNSDQSIYTKEAFECIGLRVEPDFEFEGTFDVYYYDFNGTLIETKRGLDEIYDEDFPLAKLARVVINPDVPETMDEEDFKIRFWDVYDYASQFNITVDKKQEYLYEDSENLYLASKLKNGKTFYSTNVTDWNSIELVDKADVSVTEAIKVDGSFSTYDVFVWVEETEGAWPTLGLFDESGKIIYSKGDGRNGYIYDNVSPTNLIKPCWVKLTIDIPELESYEGVHLMVQIPNDSSGQAPANNCYIFGYND